MLASAGELTTTQFWVSGLVSASVSTSGADSISESESVRISGLGLALGRLNRDLDGACDCDWTCNCDSVFSLRLDLRLGLWL